MKRREWTAGLFILTVFIGIVGFSRTEPRSVLTASHTEPLSPIPPAEVVYSAFFHFVVDLQKHAAELENEGKKGESLRSYVQTQAGLNDEEARRLGEIAVTCVEEVSQQDAKALDVIKEFQSRFPGGRIPKGIKIPSPPSELKLLQEERGQIILNARRKLLTDLGESGFDKIAKFAGRRIALSVRRDSPDRR